MTTLRTRTGLSRRDVRGLLHDGYEIIVIETMHLDEGDDTTIVWHREDGPDAIQDWEIPY